ncbi:hypothetical protein [Bacillus cereus]|uniref:hypothetical protein n=1 Tax=Bacillus cereus TaxID=1396 RepID=UPI0015CF5DBD|nr:hypothetical protein [Bacillus cereus]
MLLIATLLYRQCIAEAKENAVAEAKPLKAACHREYLIVFKKILYKEKAFPCWPTERLQ